MIRLSLSMYYKIIAHSLSGVGQTTKRLKYYSESLS